MTSIKLPPELLATVEEQLKKYMGNWYNDGPMQDMTQDAYRAGARACFLALLQAKPEFDQNKSQASMPRLYEHIDRVDLWIMAQSKYHSQMVSARDSIITAQAAEIADLKAKLEGVVNAAFDTEKELEVCEEKLSKYKTYGTDQCTSCECGRITLYYGQDKCINCAPEQYWIKAGRG